MTDKLCPECRQPMLKKNQKRKHTDEYRHAQGCPLDDTIQLCSDCEIAESFSRLPVKEQRRIINVLKTITKGES